MVCLQSLHSVGVVTIVFFNYMPYILVPFSFDNITWVLLIFFFFLILHGVCVVRIMGCALVGGLILLFMYHHLFLCCLWSLYCISLHFFSFLCSVCSFLYPFVPLCFPSYHLCTFSRLDENFWGVWVHVHYMQPHICILR